MNELEQYNFYKELERTKVSVREEKHKFVHAGHYYTDTIYSFNQYKLVKTQYEKSSRRYFPEFIIVYKNDRPLDSWNESNQTTKYIYDMYVACKNKSEKKSFINPFNNPKDSKTIAYNFDKEISNSLVKVLPQEMSDKINVIKEALKKTFEDMMKQYQ